MSLTITQFSQQLKKYFTDVRIIEKISPSKAPDFWLYICKFIVDFAKSPNCPRDLRKNMTLQAEAILNKVKRLKSGEIDSVLNSEQSKVGTPTPKPTSASKESITTETPSDQPALSEDDMFNTLLDLPSIPSESDTPGDMTVDLAPQPGSPDDLHPAEDSKPQPGQIELSPESKSLLSNDKISLEDLEDELKKMPSNLKEIAPSDYDNQTIVPPSGTTGGGINLNDFKSDTETLDITTQNQPTLADQLASGPKPTPPTGTEGKSDTPLFKISGAPPVAQSTAGATDQFDAPKDPFTNPEIEAENPADVGSRICFACGEPLDAKQVICPRCRAENPLQ